MMGGAGGVGGEAAAGGWDWSGGVSSGVCVGNGSGVLGQHVCVSDPLLLLPPRPHAQSADKRRLPFKDRLTTYLLVVSTPEARGETPKAKRDGVVHGEAVLRYLGRRHRMLGAWPGLALVLFVFRVWGCLTCARARLCICVCLWLGPSPLPSPRSPHHHTTTRVSHSLAGLPPPPLPFPSPHPDLPITNHTDDNRRHPPGGPGGGPALGGAAGLPGGPHPPRLPPGLQDGGWVSRGWTDGLVVGGLRRWVGGEGWVVVMVVGRRWVGEGKDGWMDWWW